MSDILSSTQEYPFAFAGQKPIMDAKERFYRQFQVELTDIQNRIKQLSSLAVVGGERQDATDSILAGISKLSLEVADASDFIPAYDQRTYSESVKGLTDKLNEELGRLAPKSRFQFKRTPKPAADASAGTGAAPAADPRLLRGVPRTASPTQAVVDEPDTVGALPSFTPKNYNAEMARPTGKGAIRKPSFSAAREVAISGHTGLHIILPLSASRATSSGSLTDMHACVVDMSVPTSSTVRGGGGSAFLSLMVKNIDRSLIVAGQVNGPVHITGLKNCIVVVSARQVRIHECHNVDVYLFCGSRPIIEDCSGMRFAPIPAFYDEAKTESTNQWDQVDDFKWLKADHSPNWSVLPDEKRLPETVWAGAVTGGPGMSTEDVLKVVGIGKAE